MPSTDTTYIVEIEQDYCLFEDTVYLYLDPGCMVDTMDTTNIVDPVPAENYAFSPNNDGVNDVFVLDFLDTLATDNYVAIFNRWGDLVYEAHNYNNVDIAWDGRHNNKAPVPGTYFFVVQTEEFQRLRGWVQVVR